MDLPSKILFFCTAILMIVSVSASYFRFIVIKDYEAYYDDYGESEFLETETEIE